MVVKKNHIFLPTISCCSCAKVVGAQRLINNNLVSWPLRQYNIDQYCSQHPSDIDLGLVSIPCDMREIGSEVDFITVVIH